MNTCEALNNYATIRNANEMINRDKPVLDAIMSFGTGNRIAVKDVGIKMMGDQYLAKIKRGKDPYSWESRSNEARSLTGCITQAFCMLVRIGQAIKTVEVDKDNPYVFEDEDYVYLDKDGNRIPEIVELTLADGSTIKVRAEAMPNVKKTWGKVKRIVYPKITYYTLK